MSSNLLPANLLTHIINFTRHWRKRRKTWWYDGIEEQGHSPQNYKEKQLGSVTRDVTFVGRLSADDISQLWSLISQVFIYVCDMVWGYSTSYRCVGACVYVWRSTGTRKADDVSCVVTTKLCWNLVTQDMRWRRLWQMVSSFWRVYCSGNYYYSICVFLFPWCCSQ